ncbi:hypothetical protein L1887_55791 [Cichorium endivia]|nr:hypothetical protein L1887_55791 [Cichorium endivia]
MRALRLETHSACSECRRLARTVVGKQAGVGELVCCAVCAAMRGREFRLRMLVLRNMEDDCQPTSADLVTGGVSSSPYPLPNPEAACGDATRRLNPANRHTGRKIMSVDLTVQKFALSPRG